MPLVYLSLGSNLGRRKGYIRRAIEILKKSPQFELESISSFYETEPEGLKKQPRFINICLKAKTNLPPDRLLNFLKQIEVRLGRKKRRRWGPREIDIDILFYGKKVLKKRGLIIPHPRLEHRAFVLNPLYEISPYLRHPVSKLTVGQLLRRIRTENTEYYKNG